LDFKKNKKALTVRALWHGSVLDIAVVSGGKKGKRTH
jgi:hypothetical protein